MISFEPANQYGTMPGNPNALDDATPICVGRMHPYKLWIIWRKCPQCRRTVWHVSVLNSISSCYGSIPLAVGLIGRDGDLSTLCHSCRVVCQQMVLKTFPGPGYLPSEDGVVWLWHSLVNLYMAHHFIMLRLNPFDLRVDREGWWFEHSCVIVAGLLVSRGC